MGDGPEGEGQVFLIGYRGSGKTTVARLVAAAFGWDALDADEVLEARAGRGICQIFAEEGEAGFRARESALLRELCDGRRQVIATGGGVVLSAANREQMRAAGRIIWLTADVDTLWQRLQGDSTTQARRPALTVGGRAEIEELLRLRTPLYHSCAHGVVETAGLSPEEVANAVIALLQSKKKEN
jgi:shikimate kinase